MEHLPIAKLWRGFAQGAVDDTAQFLLQAGEVACEACALGGGDLDAIFVFQHIVAAGFMGGVEFGGGFLGGFGAGDGVWGVLALAFNGMGDGIHGGVLAGFCPCFLPSAPACNVDLAVS